MLLARRKNKPQLNIGVFDSGVGGLAVARAIQKALPQHQVIYKNDKKHVPYGNKDIEEIHGYVLPILKELEAEGCQVIVIACNTVTTNLIQRLRTTLKVPLVGMEPAIKPAALATKSKVIAVCATPRTLASQRYNWLKKVYAADVVVLEPDCSDWSAMIENNDINRDKVSTIVEDICGQGADQIVLGCTHYHWIEDLIKHSAGKRAKVIQPEKPVIKRLRKVLKQLA